jgi:LCP family protein required for cell wall assembly
MLARIDPQRGRVALLSFPRDLVVDFPGYGSGRINAAYVWGEQYNAPGGGLGLARDTVSSLTGVPIDYAVLVDFQGFIGLIDSIGGVTVGVPKELYDARFPTMDYGYTVAHFLAGRQQMDGATALTYSRVRHPDSDFERIKRQQAVLIAIGARLRERGDLQNLLAADQITAALRSYVQMDIPQKRVLGLVWALRGLNPARVERYTVDENMVTFGLGDDQYAELAAPGAIESLVRQWYGE